MRIKRLIVQTFLTISVLISSSIAMAETQLESMEKLLVDPAIPETMKAQIRANIEKIRVYDEAMRTKTTFKSGKEWNAHFKYSWGNVLDEMEEDFRNLKLTWFSSRNLLSDRVAKSNESLNKKYNLKLLEGNRFSKTIVDGADLNNARSFHLLVAEILVNHGLRQTFQYKSDNEVPVSTRSIIEKEENISFLFEQVENYFKEARKIKVGEIRQRSLLTQERNSELLVYVSNLKRPSAPPVEKKYYRNYGFYGNYHRDYISMVGELDGFSFVKNLQEKQLSEREKILVGMAVTDSEIEEAEFSKVKSKVTLLLDAQLAKQNLVSLEAFFDLYRRETLDHFISDKKKLARSTANALSSFESNATEAAKKEYRAWSDNFVNKNFSSENMSETLKKSYENTAKKMASNLAYRMSHWGGFFH